MSPSAILSDAPANLKQDLLNFDRYLDPLVALLSNPRVETPFAIGVFGSWGSGKTTLHSMLDERLQEEHPDQFVRVHFNPWIHPILPLLPPPSLLEGA